MSSIEGSNSRPDIYIGLVGGAGTDLDPMKDQLKAQLAAVDYEYVDVKVSRLIQNFCDIDTKDLPEDERVVRLMNGGDEIRKAAERGDGVISLAVTEIRRLRRACVEAKPPITTPRAYVIDSLKNPSEVRTLKEVYGNNFFVVSVYSPKIDRITRLAKMIAKGCGTGVRAEHRRRAKAVIDDDEHRDSSELSQDVRGTFPLADLFVSHKENIETQAKRFIELIFGEPFTTPTLPEYLMFVAKAAAFRSCDLSRQVGAVIADDGGAILATGCNDVPYPGGGIYFEGREGATDNRDHKIEYDPNALEILNSIREIVDAFKGAGILSQDMLERTPDDIAAALMHGEMKDHLVEARVRNLIEFGRIVHAEMNALAEAARYGRRVQDSTLYCTTFPCHMCARHLIAAGIKNVVFIEPYPKSMTKTLYDAEILADETTGNIDGAVEFKPFTGISPRLYQRVFEYRPRKNRSGTIVQWKRSMAIPMGGELGIKNETLEISLSGRVDEIRTKIHKSKPAESEGGQHA